MLASSPGQTRFGSEFAAPSNAICWAARYICRPLFIVPVIWPLVSALVRAGTAKAARTAMIEITTSISIKVNADWKRVFIEEEWIIWFLENINYQKRALTGKLFFFFFERHRGQGRKVDTKGMPPSLPGFVGRGDPAEIAHVATAISLGISIDDFTIKTGPRSANVIAVMHYRRGVYDKDNNLVLTGFTDPRDNAVFGIVKINPLESLVSIVKVPKRRLAFVEVIQMLNQAAQSVVQRRPH